MSQGINDMEWFRRVFDQHYGHIRNYLYYLSGDIDLAEDLTQDIFLMLWEEQAKVRKETTLSYLFTAAKNQYFKHHRRKNIQFNFISSINHENDHESPDFILEMKEYDFKVQQVLADIPDKTRSIFLMSRIDKMTYTEIAERLKISNKGVEKHMNKALKILKEKLDRKL